MSIYELKIYLNLDPKSKSKILDRYAKKFYLGYFFVDSEDGHCYLFDRYGKEKDISLVHEIHTYMIRNDIQKIVIPDYVTNIWDYAFYHHSGLMSVTIPDSVMHIGQYAFSGCSSLTNVTIPNSVTSIRDCAFEYCSKLTNMTIGKSVTDIRNFVFYGCSRLMNLTIPDSVISIEGSAFYNCSGLKSLVFKNKTIDQVKAMKSYPFGIENESVIKAELS